MDENLRLMLDSVDDLIVDAGKQLAKTAQVFTALYEEIEDGRASDELPGMLADTARHAYAAEGTLLAIRDYMSDIGKELL